MANFSDFSSDATIDSVARRRVAMHLQVIEGNPLSRDEVAMFEMFEREGWSHEGRRAYILARMGPIAAGDAEFAAI